MNRGAKIAQDFDELTLFAQVRNTWGLQRSNRELAEGLTHGLYYRLRWGGRNEEAAALCIILLKNKKLFLLLMHLTNFFKKDDADMIKEIFEVYDSDGSGSIEEDELVEGLKAIGGFSTSDSMTIFRQIDADGQGSISMEEFQSWWMVRFVHRVSSTRCAIVLSLLKYLSMLNVFASDTLFSSRMPASQSTEGRKVAEAMKQQRLDDFSMFGLFKNLDLMEAHMVKHERTLGEHLHTLR